MSTYCTVLAIRHGQTEWNTIARYQGWMNSKLTADGLAQAEQLAQGLKRRFSNEAKPSALYCSDLGRAQQTATPLSRELGLTVISDARLRESSLGIFEGLTEAEFSVKYPKETELFKSLDPDYALPNGESSNQLFNRMTGAVKDIAAKHIGQTILLVSHGGALGMLYRAAQGMAINRKRDFAIPNAAVNEFRVTASSIELVKWGDVSHLAVVDQADPYEAV
jgi:2,3-bisphosphoglycerate-dependent phosphoglycerate mutase